MYLHKCCRLPLAVIYLFSSFRRDVAGILHSLSANFFLCTYYGNVLYRCFWVMICMVSPVSCHYTPLHCNILHSPDASFTFQLAMVACATEPEHLVQYVLRWFILKRAQSPYEISF